MRFLRRDDTRTTALCCAIVFWVMTAGADITEATWLEECPDINCSPSKVSGLYASYHHEIYEESNPKYEEVLELVAYESDKRQRYVGHMLQDFLDSGQKVRSRDLTSARLVSPSPSSVWLYTGGSQQGDVYEFPAANTKAVGQRILSGVTGQLVYATLKDATGVQSQVFGRTARLSIQSLAAVPQVSPRAPITIAPISADTIPNNQSTGTVGFTASVPAGKFELFPLVLAKQNPGQCENSCSVNNDLTFPIPDPGSSAGGWNSHAGPFQVLINASFFISCTPTSYSTSKCAKNTGVLVRDGTLVDPPSSPDTDGKTLLDGLLFTNDGQVMFSLNQDLGSNLSKGAIETAISGYYFIRSGAIVVTGGLSTLHKAATPEPRTAIGLDANKTLWIAVLQMGSGKGGATAQDFGTYMKTTLGVTDALMLDGGGSSQFLGYGVQLMNTVIWMTPAGDAQGYRPIPVAVGLRARTTP